MRGDYYDHYDAKQKAWYGKTCIKCGSAINYAYAAKGLIPGMCGKCVDEVKEGLRRDIERQMRANRGSAGFREVVDPDLRIPSRRLWWGVGVGCGLLLAVLGLALLPEQAHWVGGQLRQLLGLG